MKSFSVLMQIETNFTKTENRKSSQFMNPNFIRLKQHQFKHAKRDSYHSRPI